MTGTTLTREAIIESASRECFGRPLVNNVLRAVLVEAMVDAALPDEWRWCSGDWALCDFLHEDGTRLEVKQSAARQSWHGTDAPPSPGRFDIAARTSAWDGVKWVPSTGRNAEIYVFCHHPVTGADADHRDPGQWLFHAVSARALPDTKTATLTLVRRLSSAVPVGMLAERVEDLRRQRAA